MKRDWNWSHRYGKSLSALLAEFQSWFNYDTAILNDAIQLCKGNVRWLAIPSSKHNHSQYNQVLSPLITKTLDHDIIWPEARDEIKECTQTDSTDTTHNLSFSPSPPLLSLYIRLLHPLSPSLDCPSLLELCKARRQNCKQTLGTKARIVETAAQSFHSHTHTQT